MLGRKIKISFFFKSAKLLGPFLTLLQSQKSTKAAALVALVVMTPLLPLRLLENSLEFPVKKFLVLVICQQSSETLAMQLFVQCNRRYLSFQKGAKLNW